MKITITIADEDVSLVELARQRWNANLTPLYTTDPETGRSELVDPHPDLMADVPDYVRRIAADRVAALKADPDLAAMLKDERIAALEAELAAKGGEA